LTNAASSHMGYTITNKPIFLNMINFLAFIALIITITVHEFSHALAADILGDPTPRSYGRLSLNPLVHADLIGTFLLPFVTALTGLPTIGWAKPVPIDTYNLAHPRRDEFIIALAGPASNFIIAIITAIFINITGYNLIFLQLIILINISIAIFNLIPLWPLDGSKIFLNLLPVTESVQWQDALSRYSTPILLIALFLPINGSNLLSIIMTPPIQFFSRILIPGF